MEHRSIRRGLWAWLVLMIALLPVVAQETAERIAYQRDGAGVAPTNILVMFAGKGTAVELQDSRDLSGPRVTPALSPDGRTIAFAAKDGEQYKIFTWTLDEQNNAVGAPVRLSPPDTDTSDKFPSWSPDGERIAYLATSGNNKTTLRLINKDGTGMEVLSEVNYFSTPSWHPNGQWLLYIDRANNKPVLKSAPASGGLVITIRPESKITAACYSPDGNRIAALIQGKNGMSELWVMPTSGKGGNKVAEKIVDARDIAWPSTDAIIVSAVKIGSKTGQAFWYFKPGGGLIKGISAYAAPSKVRYFSVRNSDFSGAIPTVVNPEGPFGTDNGTGAPTERVPTGPVTITRPAADTTVRGVVPVRIIAQKDVASIVIRIGDQFAYASVSDAAGEPVAQHKYNWNTQALVPLEPSRAGLPSRYQQMLRYPDGRYTVTVLAMNSENKLLGKDTISVNVENSIPDSSLPGELQLRYYYSENAPEERMSIRGEGIVAGATPGDNILSSLNNSLEGVIRRSLVEARPGSFDLRTYFDSAQKPLAYGTATSAIPEQSVSARYALTQSGDLSVITQLRERIYLPLAQVFVPLSRDAVQVGTSWLGKMWIVPDLLGRSAAPVNASHTVDGVEWIGDRRAVRIRSEYALDTKTDDFALDTKPTKMRPSLQESRFAAPAAGPIPGMNPMGATMMSTTDRRSTTIKITEGMGVRYSWFDYERGRLLRVEDLILYAFPATNVPNAQGTPGMPAAPAPGGYAPGPAGGPMPGPGMPPDPAMQPPMGGPDFGGPAAMPPTMTPGGRTGRGGTTKTPKVSMIRYLVHYSFAQVGPAFTDTGDED